MRVFALACLAVFAASLFAACTERTGSNAPESTPPTATPTAIAPSPTPTPPATATVAPAATAHGGCTVPESNLGRSTVHTLNSGNTAREFRLALPGDATDAQDGPVVLNFHGLGSNMDEQELYSGLAPIAQREGFVLVTPNGTGSPRSWSAFENFPIGANDIQFVRDLLATLESEFCIDTSAVYATGMSNGAFMSSRLACALGDQIAAIAPVAGVYFPQATCSARVAVLAFHGTDDLVVPFEPGTIFGLLPYAGAEAGVHGWAEHNGCTPVPGKEEQLASGVRLQAYESCGGGAGTQLVIVDGGGHTWPGAPAIPRLGPTTQSISAAEMIWEFFAAHPPAD